MISVLFVCMGNICRSPAGEGVFNSRIRDAGLENRFRVDSAGTSAWHSGEPADPRMRKHASKRDIQLVSKARRFSRTDFKTFDYIIAMDRQNYNEIISLDQNSEYEGKVCMMNDFSAEYSGYDVPDPYYGGAAGFELVLDMLEDSCSGLLDKIRADHGF